MRKLLCLLAAGLLVFGVACGGGDDETEPAATEEESTDEESTDVETPEGEVLGEATGGVLDFTGTEFAFAGPETAAAGELSITFTNNGEQEHEMAALPLKEGAPSVEELADLPEKELQKYAAGPFGGTEGPIKPGKSKTFTIDATDAGSVAYVCFVRDPKTKKPHVALGMLGSITIE
jgi:plastocyanin